MKQPWLSVIMPVFNGAEYIGAALESVVAQKDENIECIVVDGASTDTTIDIVNSFRNRLNIKLLHREKESNWVIKTNDALKHATGEYACFLHHDDLWLDNRLSVLKKIIVSSPNVTMFVHPSYYIDNTGNRLGVWNCPLSVFPTINSPSSMTEKLLIQNFISIVGPIFKRTTALEIGGMDEKLWYTADWDFWLKMAACGNTIYLTKPFSAFRIHINSQTIRRSSYLTDFKAQLEFVYEKHAIIWSTSDSRHKQSRRIGKFSIEVNSALAGFFHGSMKEFFLLLLKFLLLGPSGIYHYISISRINERVMSRAKGILISRFRKGSALP